MARITGERDITKNKLDWIDVHGVSKNIFDYIFDDKLN